MPTRLLRPGILDSRQVNELPEHVEIFYRRLMSVVDDHGRCEADSELLRAGLFARQFDRWSLARVTEALSILSAPPLIDGQEPLVRVYQVGYKKYLEINKFGQRARGASKFPSPDAINPLTNDGGARASADNDGGARASADNDGGARASADNDGGVRASADNDGGVRASADNDGGVRAMSAYARATNTNTNTHSPPHSDEAFRIFWNRYPLKDGENLCCQLWLSLVTPENQAAVLACLDRYLKSEQVSRGVVKSPRNWLHDSSRDGWAADWPAANGHRKAAVGLIEELLADEED